MSSLCQVQQIKVIGQNSRSQYEKVPLSAIDVYILNLQRAAPTVNVYPYCFKNIIARWFNLVCCRVLCAKVVAATSSEGFPVNICILSCHNKRRILSDKVVDVQIVDVVTTVKQSSAKVFRFKHASRVVPDSPGSETEPFDFSKCSQISCELMRRHCSRHSTLTKLIFIFYVKLDEQLFDFRQALGTGQDGVERTPFGTVDVYFQNVDCPLQTPTADALSRFSRKHDISPSMK